jgi:hypothetical protein
MRIILILAITAFICSCSKKSYIDVSSIDQVPGKWKWESTCGGIIPGCKYSSKTDYATIEFTTDGKYIETHNETIYLQSGYLIIKSDDTFGTLVLESKNISRPITIIDNRLLITRGELMDSYLKIK